MDRSIDKQIEVDTLTGKCGQMGRCRQINRPLDRQKMRTETFAETDRHIDVVRLIDMGSSINRRAEEEK